MKLTKKKINELFRDVLKHSFSGDKDRFGRYFVDLKKGGIAIGYNLEELKEDIERKVGE